MFPKAERREKYWSSCVGDDGVGAGVGDWETEESKEDIERVLKEERDVISSGSRNGSEWDQSRKDSFIFGGKDKGRKIRDEEEIGYVGTNIIFHSIEFTVCRKTFILKYT